MPLISVYDWSMVTTPAVLAPYLSSAQHANAPGTSTYDGGQPSWTGQTYTYNGGAPVHVKIIDDDGLFEDGSSETGGAAVLAEDVTLNGVTYAAGSVVENQFTLMDGAGSQVWVVTIDGQNVGFSPQVPYYYIPGGVTFTPTQARDGPGGTFSTDGVSNTTAYSNVVCFAARTRIETPLGPRRASDILRGDRVLSVDHGDVSVLWAGAQRVRFDGRADHRRPVLIPVDALGLGRPSRAVAVSPQHRVLVPTPTGPRLVAAKALIGWRGIRVVRGWSEVCYVHLMCARHELLTCDGLATESLLLGPQALLMLPPGLRHALRAACSGQFPTMTPARPCLSVRQGHDLVESWRGPACGNFKTPPQVSVVNEKRAPHGGPSKFR